MNGMTSHWIYSGYNSDQGVSYTHEWDFGPSFTVAQASFYGVGGGGLHHTGIVSYRHRPDPNGPDIPVDVGDVNDFHTWKPFIYVDQCSGVTFATVVGAEQDAYMLANLFFW